MSQLTTVTAGQSLLDVSAQELGSVAAAFELADANGLALTDVLAPGSVLVVPASAAAQPEVASYFAARRQRLNSGDLPSGPAPHGPVGLRHDFDAADFDSTDFDA